MKWPCILSSLIVGTGCSAYDSSQARLRTTPSGFPQHWWEPVPKAEAASWEILPQEAGRGEVILSSRNELGLLSNFAETPFVFRGKRYRSIEGFWQMMKYPEDSADQSN